MRVIKKVIKNVNIAYFNVLHEASFKVCKMLNKMFDKVFNKKL